MDMITVEKRNEKAKAKQLRQSGTVPCVIYGGGLKESLSVQMDQNTASKLFRQKREGSKLRIKLDDQLFSVQIKDKTWNVLNREIVHISFQVLKADQKVNSVAHIIFQNTDKVTGFLEKLLFEIPYASFPDDMIDTVTVDLDQLPIGTVMTIGDIAVFKNEKVELQLDMDSIIFRISETKSSSVQEIE